MGNSLKHFIQGEGVKDIQDLYGAALKVSTLSVKGLANATHTVVISVSGLRNPRSRSYVVMLDALGVVP